MKTLITSFYSKIMLILFAMGAIAVYVPIHNSVEAAPRTVFLKLANDQPEPKIELSTSVNATGQLLLEIDAESFEFTEFCKSKTTETVLGHAHVIVDGVKIGTAYNPLFELSDLTPGRHEIKVTLQGQDHRTLLGKQGIIETSMIIDVPTNQDA